MRASNVASSKKKVVVITGATGSGKSALAMKLADKINGIIINADSMQIYRQIPIISAQPNQNDMHQIPHLLYGFVDIFDSKIKYSVNSYLCDVSGILSELDSKMNNKMPIIVGGTMLYIDALLNGLNYIPNIPTNIGKDIRYKYANMPIEYVFQELYKLDKKYANIVDKNNRQRLIRGIEVKIATGKSIIEFWDNTKRNGLINKDKYDVKKILLDLPRNILYDRINMRFDKMLADGAMEEARHIYDHLKVCNASTGDLPKAIGLQEFFDHFNGSISASTAIESAKQASRNYAKRQLTWFRNRFQSFITITNDTSMQDILKLCLS